MYVMLGREGELAIVEKATCDCAAGYVQYLFVFKHNVYS